MSNTTDTLTLTDFLLARIAEDEAFALAAAGTNGTDWAAEELSYGCGEVGVFGSLEPGHSRAFKGQEDFALWDNEGALGMFRGTAEHVALHDPARVLAECKTKRAIVEMHANREGPYDYCISCAYDTSIYGDMDPLDWPCPTIRALASVYADHPDYRSEWA